MAGELLPAYVARAQAAPPPEHVAAAEELPGLMLAVSERMGRELPYGYGCPQTAPRAEAPARGL